MSKVRSIGATAAALIGALGATAPAMAQAPPDPVVSVGDAFVYEGWRVQRIVLVPVTLDRPHSSDVVVSYATADETAIGGLDYVATAGTVVIPAGRTQRHIAVPIRPDQRREDRHQQVSGTWRWVYESFAVQISASDPSVAIERGSGRVQVRDHVIGLTIDDVTIVEGDAGPRHWAEMTLHLSSPATERITGTWRTTADGSADAADFRSSGGTIEFQPGEIRRRVRVPIVADEVTELDESFTVTLANLSPAAQVQDSSGLITILDDD